MTTKSVQIFRMFCALSQISASTQGLSAQTP